MIRTLYAAVQQRLKSRSLTTDLRDAGARVGDRNRRTRAARGGGVAAGRESRACLGVGAATVGRAPAAACCPPCRSRIMCSCLAMIGASGCSAAEAQVWHQGEHDHRRHRGIAAGERTLSRQQRPGYAGHVGRERPSSAPAPSARPPSHDHSQSPRTWRMSSWNLSSWAPWDRSVTVSGPTIAAQLNVDQPPR